MRTRACGRRDLRLHEPEHEAVARPAPIPRRARRGAPVARVVWIAQEVALGGEPEAGRLHLVAQARLVDAVQRLGVREPGAGLRAVIDDAVAAAGGERVENRAV